MTENTDLITINDVRKAGFCARGIYDLARQKGWDREDFKKFVKDGATVEELRQLGEDALLERVLEVKRRSNDG